MAKKNPWFEKELLPVLKQKFILTLFHNYIIFILFGDIRFSWHTWRP